MSFEPNCARGKCLFECLSVNGWDGGQIGLFFWQRVPLVVERLYGVDFARLGVVLYVQSLYVDSNLRDRDAQCFFDAEFDATNDPVRYFGNARAVLDDDV